MNNQTTIVASSVLTVHDEDTAPALSQIFVVDVRGIRAAASLDFDAVGLRLVLMPFRANMPAISADLGPMLRAMAIEALRHARPANDTAAPAVPDNPNCSLTPLPRPGAPVRP